MNNEQYSSNNIMKWTRPLQIIKIVLTPQFLLRINAINNNTRMNTNFTFYCYNPQIKLFSLFLIMQSRSSLLKLAWMNKLPWNNSTYYLTLWSQNHVNYYHNLN